MRRDNLTWESEFVLLGLSSDRQTQAGLFVLFAAAYLLTLLGNGLIILLIGLDARLHLPMYFFLCNLSVMDICYTSSGVPQMLVHFLLEKKTISFTQCGAQLFFSLALGGTEFLLLAAMAYGCYMAVCAPLCSIAVVSWLIGLVSSVVETVVMMYLPTCGPNVIDHHFCDSAPLLKLSCSDACYVECMDFFLSLLFMLATMLLIIVSYILIVAAVLHIPSFSGHQKAFSTCVSHLAVVVLGYGSDIFIYVRPGKGHFTHFNKVVALMTVVVTPFLNPFIFTFRNEKVKEVIGDMTKSLLLRDPAARG
ncbi:olfactory receptor 2F1-like [Lynx canadensis]|uniref:olfactory receptor 2F1-like n=1 Tax=Lynx canadensis TaxID=61383 RepID=UPI0011B0B5E6|nr:olfactory receptor 2F1-like [Lynx canadensis]